MLHDFSGNPVMRLLKLGAREHMKQFRQGVLYMNTLNYFRGLEGDCARADRHEGITHIFQPNEVMMRLSLPGAGEVEVDPKDLAGATTISLDSELRCNVFCLHSITTPVNGPLFSPKYEWFGDSVVLILDTQAFLDRILTAAKARNLELKGALVVYFDDETYSGRLNRFMKSKQFAYQREYRITVGSPGTKPLILNIGNITDITSEVVRFCDANDTFKFSEVDAREAGLLW